MIKKAFIIKSLLVVTTLPLLLAACNTMEGAGTDIKKAGQSLENTAAKNK